ncbi:M10 family metallopeptidase C-terminal domain-containing protein, partial [Klebsiella pneumoniae]|nr:M10 family metallopeptidase C-terminal domain-containing protein [Klebsiella pneumoniae]
KNVAPVVAIYDAGGNDTLDFSGWNTPSVIDLNAGAFSSGGGIEEFLTLEQVNANRAAQGLAPRTQAVFDAYTALREELGLTSGLYKDNISI